jgi:transporter family-2 protein
MGSVWLYPLILAAGALQAWGPPMNGALRVALTNPWLASIVSFLPIVAVLAIVFFCAPRPLPTIEGINAMPWWAPLGGLIGAVAVVAGLLFVDRVGAGPFAALLIGANLLMSVAIDHFGMFGIAEHPLTLLRAAGALLMVAGIAVITLS